MSKKAKETNDEGTGGNRFGTLVIAVATEAGDLKVIDDNGGEGYGTTPVAEEALKQLVTKAFEAEEAVGESYQLIRLVKTVTPSVKVSVQL